MTVVNVRGKNLTKFNKKKQFYIDFMSVIQNKESYEYTFYLFFIIRTSSSTTILQVSKERSPSQFTL